MKKFVLILAVVALLVSAGAAMASESYWAVQFTCGWNTGSSYTNGNSITVGAKTGNVSTTALAGYDPPNDGDAPIGVWYNSAIKSKDLVGLGSPAVPLTSYSYDVGVLVTPSYGHSNKVYISAFSCDGIGGSSGRDLPVGSTVIVQNAAQTETYATWSQSDIYVEGTSFPTSDVLGNVGFWYTASGTGSAWNSSNVQQFKVTVNMPVPEPGSLLALGSGFVGMLGFVIRRRRA